MITGCAVWKIDPDSVENRPAKCGELRTTMVDRRTVDRAQHAIGNIRRTRYLQEVAS